MRASQYNSWDEALHQNCRHWAVYCLMCDGATFQVKRDKRDMVREYIGKALRRNVWGKQPL